MYWSLYLHVLQFNMYVIPTDTLALLIINKGRFSASGIGCGTRGVWMVTHKASGDAEVGSTTSNRMQNTRADRQCQRLCSPEAE